ncbi:[Pyruvate dehydrogenase [acetyl-transferring]]-phosphatase 1, mitochondrial [Tieghemiomyces parasiticus]|uniref:[Pyruvate dehydrogenase [acetyl-transferring]]-phosphatase 1, mitochondrial n=1 Tax=Tieghemiomyces parasiticus TaxID=78921 RepID=A0A9W7ZM28_9FUNG|nr:[Pyruvate dehydrogenase [acetyl-transferring]]-phosphatase 1, mitochondrial [Tieghemiomyces parasiticus]
MPRSLPASPTASRSRQGSRYLDVTPVGTNQTTTSTISSTSQQLSPRNSVGTGGSLSPRSSVSSLRSEGPSDNEQEADDTKRRFGFRLPFFSRKLNFSLDLKRSPSREENGGEAGGASSRRPEGRRPQRSAKPRSRSKSSTRQRSRAASVTYLDNMALDHVAPLTPEEMTTLLTRNAAGWNGAELVSPAVANITFTTPTSVRLPDIPAIRVSTASSSDAAPPVESPDAEDVPPGVIRRLDFNQVPSANPVEDRYSRTHVSVPGGRTRWHIIGIYDGHSGHQTAEYIARWLPEKISAALRGAFYPKVHSPSAEDPANVANGLAACTLNPSASEPTCGGGDEPDIREILQRCFVEMDREIVHDALHRFVDDPAHGRNQLFPAITGSCAVVAVVDDFTGELFVAHCGDSRAILGVQKAAIPAPGSVPDPTSPYSPRLAAAGGSPHEVTTQLAAVQLPHRPTAVDSPWCWRAIQLTSDHNAAIELERMRLNREHMDGVSVVISDRVLGLLAVTRAFGDASFKWHRHLVQAIYPGLYADKKCPDPQAVISPPYITARPDVFRLKLRPQDRFLVLATDGLFEGLSNELVAELVGGFYEQVVNPNLQDQDPGPVSLVATEDPATQSAGGVPLTISPTVGVEADQPVHHTQPSLGPETAASPQAIPAGSIDLATNPDPDDKYNFMIDDPTYIPTEERRQFLDPGLSHGVQRGSPIYQDVPESDMCRNAATLLAENTFNVISQGSASALLALKAPESSNYRDDVTVAVLFF